MGLADRFKDQLKGKDIFKNNEDSIDQTMEENDIKFVSKPISNTIEPKNLHIKPTETIKTDKFEDFETIIIDKIRKTPYWEDFTPERQVNMISSYFDKKIVNSKITYSDNERLDFIQNILALSNNR